MFWSHPLYLYMWLLCSRSRFCCSVFWSRGVCAWCNLVMFCTYFIGIQQNLLGSDVQQKFIAGAAFYFFNYPDILAATLIEEPWSLGTRLIGSSNVPPPSRAEINVIKVQVPHMPRSPFDNQVSKRAIIHIFSLFSFLPTSSLSVWLFSYPNYGEQIAKSPWSPSAPAPAIT